MLSETFQTTLPSTMFCEPLPDRAVKKDARILCIVNDVIANDVAVAAFLDLDTVALVNGGAIRMVNVVAFDQAVGNSAAVVIAAEVHAFAGTVRMMNVIAQYLESLIGPA